MATASVVPRKVAVSGRIDLSDTKRAAAPSSRADGREPVKARVRTASVVPSPPPGPVRARVREPDTPPAPSSAGGSTSTGTRTGGGGLTRSTSSHALHAAGGSDVSRPRRTRAKSADPDSPAFGHVATTAPSTWTSSTPPVPPIPAVHRSATTATARRILTSPSDSPRSVSPAGRRPLTPTTANAPLARSAPSPKVVRVRAKSIVHHAAAAPGPAPALLPSLGPATPPALSASSSTSTESTASSQQRPPTPSAARPSAYESGHPRIHPHGQPARHQRSLSSTVNVLAASISGNVSQGHGRDSTESELAAWVAAKREEDDEREARVTRKIMDLEITNASLLAINQTLERNKLKQTAELRELRQTLQHGAGISGLISPPSTTAADRRESLGEDGWDTVLREDPAFASVAQALEDLIAQGKRACAYVADVPKDAPRVLQPQLLEVPDQDPSATSSEYEPSDGTGRPETPGDQDDLDRRRGFRSGLAAGDDTSPLDPVTATAFSHMPPVSSVR